MSTRVELDGLLSNYLRRRRREQVVPYIARAKRILDVCCGRCLWKGIIGPSQYYLGLEIEAGIVEQNREDSQLDFAVFDVSSDDFTTLPGEFDLVIMLASIEHFRNPRHVLREISPKIAKGGIIALTTPAPGGERILEIGARVGLFASDKHQHAKLLGRSDLAELASAASLRMIRFHRFLFFQNQFVVLEKS